MRLALALILAICTATPAAAYLAQNGLIVRADGPEQFTVPYRGLFSPVDFWCAAGDYARNALRLPTAQRIYRVSEPPRRAGEGIDFSLRSDDSASSTGLLVIGAQRGGLTIGMAYAFCEGSGQFEPD